MISRHVQKLSDAGPAHLRQTGHPALESVAVEVGQAGNGDRAVLVAARRARHAAFDRRDDAVREGQADVLRPASRQAARLRTRDASERVLAAVVFTRNIHGHWI